MKAYLMSLGLEFWIAVEVKYAPKDTYTEKQAKQDFIANEKVMNALLRGLCESKLIKVMHSKTAKKIWDRLENIHEGGTKVNMTKLQAHRTQF